jgi:hypothetical protein
MFHFFRLAFGVMFRLFRRRGSLVLENLVLRHAQRARSEPLQNQAHSFGSVPRECPFASWLQTDDLPLNSFPLAPRQVKLEENHDATQIPKWIFDQEKQQVS